MYVMHSTSYVTVEFHDVTRGMTLSFHFFFMRKPNLHLLVHCLPQSGIAGGLFGEW